MPQDDTASSKNMNDQQLGQHIRFSPPKSTIHSPKKPSPLRQSQRISSIPEIEHARNKSLHDRTSANYLQELRNNRVARLNGSRPPPPSRIASKREQPRPFSGTEFAQATTGQDIVSSPKQSPEPVGRSDYVGRPLVTRPSSTRSVPTSLSSPSRTKTTETPQKDVVREAQSPAIVTDDPFLDEEQRIHEAAQDEAAELVWKHRSGFDPEKHAQSAYRNPEIDTKAAQKSYRTHLRTKSQDSNLVSPQPSIYSASSVSPLTSPVRSETSLDDPFSPPISPLRSTHSSGKSYEQLANAVAKDVAVSKRRVSGGSKRKTSTDSKNGFMSPTDKIFEEPDEQLKEARFAEAQKAAEKAEKLIEEAPRHARRNPFARVRLGQEKFEKKETPSGYSVANNNGQESVAGYSAKKHHRIEIQRNPPSQSRNAGYTVNNSAPESPKPPPPEIVEDVEHSPRMKDGKEIRSDDIRLATSMKRKDKSPNLPQPTAVSDSPGRPIVSFHTEWKPKEIELVQGQAKDLPECLSVGMTPPSPAALSGKQRRYSLPRSHQTLPPLPMIAIPDGPVELPGSSPMVAELDAGIPMIVIPDDTPSSPSRTLPEEPHTPGPVLPTKTTSPVRRSKEPSRPAQPPPLHHRPQSESKASPARRPLPTPNPSPSRPLPVPSKTSPFPAVGQPHMTPSVRRTTALCAHCALPISGRILSAAGQRFHPSCFKCHECSINLECVAFYPEPEKKRAERLARIQQRQQGLDVQIPEGVTEEDMRRLEESDGDASLRFFCGLDFHEAFSPRCKSCKTPIEGEVIVACGAEWHVGHFFCAQCGDPFDSSTPFVEKDGYAWCVCCHTNRYSAKCRKCRRPVTDIVVKALGAEWHADCFCCVECGNGFDDGRYFLRGSENDPVCVRCEERRLKA